MKLNEIQRAYMAGRATYMPLGGVDMQDIRCFSTIYTKEQLISAIKKVLSHYTLFNCCVRRENNCFSISSQEPDAALLIKLVQVNTEQDIVELAHRHLKEYASMLFDVEHSLWRITVLELSKHAGNSMEISSIIIFSFNGILIDGYVISKIIHEIFSRAAGFTSERLLNGCESKILGSLGAIKNLPSKQAYWATKLANLKSPITLPWLKNINQVLHVPRRRLTLPIKQDIALALLDNACANGLFENTLYSLAVLKSLNDHVQLYDFVIAIPTSQSAIKQICANTSSFFPLRYTWNSRYSLLEEAVDIQDTILNALANDIGGINVAQQLCSQLKTILPLPVVFTNALNWEPFESVYGVHYLEGQTETPQVALDIRLTRLNKECIHLDLDYAQGLLAEDVVTTLAQGIYAWICRLATEKLDSPSVFKSPKGLVNTSNRGGYNFFIEQIIQNIEINPLDTTVLINRNRALSYKELGEKVKQAKWQLKSVGIGRGDVVALCLPKSFEHVYYLLACLTSGIIWMPLDAEAPVARIILQLKNAKAVGMVADTGDEQICRAIQDHVPDIRMCIAQKLIEVSSTDNLDKPSWHYVKDRSASYYLYTSGSTGIPKCVVLNNVATDNVISATVHAWNINRHDCVMSVTPFYHDMALFDILGTLYVGATLVIPEREKAKDAFEWAYLVQTCGVSIWVSVPAIVDMLLVAATAQQLQSIRLLAQGGDYLRIKTLRQLLHMKPTIRLYSLGGPTETTIWSIWHEISLEADLERYGCIPYGRALVGNQYSILDDDYKECSANQLGKIAMSGVNLSNGYLIDGELRSDGYEIVDAALGGMVYISKDRGLKDEKGVIIFKAREEGYLKIKGVRISAEEIERHILAIASIKQCIVFELENKDFSFSELAVAYVPEQVTDKPTSLQYIDELRKYLPLTFIPTKWYPLSGFPLTANGKLDRRAVRQMLTKQTIDEPVDANRLSVPELMNNSIPTIGSSTLLDKVSYEQFIALAQSPQQVTSSPAEQIVQQIATEYEQRAWMLHQQNPLSAAGPLMVVLKLQGNIDSVRLIASLYHLYDGGSALNSTFFIQEESGALYRHLNRYEAHDVIAWHSVDTLEEGRQLLTQKMYEAIDLVLGPIIKFYLLDMKQGGYLLGIHAHHILMDNSSWALIFSMLSQLYNGTKNSEQNHIATCSVDNNREIAQQYWRQQFTSKLTPFVAPVGLKADIGSALVIHKIGHPTVSIGNSDAHRYSIEIEHEQIIKEIKDLSLATVITYFALSLLEKNNEQFLDVLVPVVGTVLGHSLDNIKNTSNVLPIRVHAVGELTIDALCQNITQQIQNGVAHDLPYEHIINLTGSDRQNLPTILVTEFDLPSKHIDFQGVTTEIIDLPPIDTYYTMTLAYSKDVLRGIVKFELTSDKTINPFAAGLLLQDFVRRLCVDNAHATEQAIQNVRIDLNPNMDVLQAIIQVYSEVLEMEVKAQDNFFDLGGIHL